MKYIIDHSAPDVAIYPIILKDIMSIVVTETDIELEYVGEGCVKLPHNMNRDKLTAKMIEFVTSSEKETLTIS
jgi:hypothetical protein